MKRKLIIIPAYNEDKTILGTVRDIVKNAPSYDYVVIDDGSNDKTFQICKREGIQVVHLPINLGIGGAVQTGYLFAKENNYDLVVQIDADGQHDPRFLQNMEELLQKEKADMVVGSRFIEKIGFQSSKFRRAGILFFTFVIKL